MTPVIGSEKRHLKMANYNEYLTIPEFAKRAGVSHQSVYKGLRNQLQPYLQLVAGKKMLSVKALSEVYGIEGCATSATKSATQENVPDGLETALQALQEQLAAKDEQLREKDRQIESLHRILEQQNHLALADKQTVMQLTGKEEDAIPAKKSWFMFWK